jgi:subtilase family serine protease
MKKMLLLVVCISLLAACQADTSSFSPDVSSTIRPQSSEAVNVADEDIKVSVRNVGEINAYEVSVSVSVNGEELREKTISELSSSDEEIIRYEKGGVLTNYCDGGEAELRVEVSPSVKDLDTANNDASQLITC